MLFQQSRHDVFAGIQGLSYFSQAQWLCCESAELVQDTRTRIFGFFEVPSWHAQELKEDANAFATHSESVADLLEGSGNARLNAKGSLCSDIITGTIHCSTGHIRQVNFHDRRALYD
jgi:hypothetical protein